MAHTITLIPGDGIGPEVTDAVVRILDAAGVHARLGNASRPASAPSSEHGTTLPADAARLDPPQQGRAEGAGRRRRSARASPASTSGLRKALDLYANLRPVVEPAGVPSRFSGVDLVIVRENTEDLYAGLEHEVVPGVVESLKIITERGVDAHRASSPSSTRGATGARR